MQTGRETDGYKDRQKDKQTDNDTLTGRQAERKVDG